MFKFKKTKTRCCHCGKEIKISIPKDVYKKTPHIIYGCSCNSCVPEYSPARNGIEESQYTECERSKLWPF